MTSFMDSPVFVNAVCKTVSVELSIVSGARI